jgi:surface protein
LKRVYSSIPSELRKLIRSYLTLTNETIRDAILGSDEYVYGPKGEWETSGVTDMSNLFSQNHDFNEPIEDWDVSNVTNMSGMFLWADSFNQPLNAWDVRNVTNMNRMFLGATKFHQSLDQWHVNVNSNVDNMFFRAYEFDPSLIATWDPQLIAHMGRIGDD